MTAKICGEETFIEWESLDYAATDDNTWFILYNDMLNMLQQLIDEFNPTGKWHVEVKNFGWRKSAGYTEFEVHESGNFLKRVLPNCDCSFKIYKREDCIAINNFHHDSPSGAEWYYAYVLKEERIF